MKKLDSMIQEFKLPEWFTDVDIESAITAIECFGLHVTYIRNGHLIRVQFAPNQTELLAQVTQVLRELIDTGFKYKSEIVFDFSDKKSNFQGPVFSELVKRGDVTEHDEGIFSYKGEFLEIRQSIDDRIATFGKSLDALSVDFPNLISIEKLKRTSFLNQYPHFLNFVLVPQSEDNHLSLLHSALNSTEPLDIKMHLNDPRHICRSSSCMHAYMNHADTVINGNLVYSTVGKCTRQEYLTGSTLERLREFSMREIIFIGSDDFVEEQISKCSDFVFNFLQSGPLQGVFQTSNDLFFPENIAALQFFQKRQRAKLELRLFIPELNKTISVASLNRHTNYFSNSYQIKLPSGQLASSACFAFGLERLAYGLYSQFGLDKKNWPLPLKQYFNLR